MIGKNELKNKLLERKSKKQIAKELFVSEPTLRKYNTFLSYREFRIKNQ